MSIGDRDGRGEGAGAEQGLPAFLRSWSASAALPSRLTAVTSQDARSLTAPGGGKRMAAGEAVVLQADLIKVLILLYISFLNESI